MTPPYRLTVTPAAAVDVVLLHDRIAADSPANAAGVVLRLLAEFDSLTYFPNRTVVSPQAVRPLPPVRSVVVTPYVIYFRVFESPKVVRIVRVRHGAQRRLRSFD